MPSQIGLLLAPSHDSLNVALKAFKKLLKSSGTLIVKRTEIDKFDD